MPPTVSSNVTWQKLNARTSLFLIAGPCVIESRDVCFQIAEQLHSIASEWNIPVVFKASFDKANRTSAMSFRGPGLESGLETLQLVREHFELPLLTDVHSESQCAPVAEVVDVLQIPAFLCRQTDLIISAAETGRIVNLKKGQFLSPTEMNHVALKASESGNQQLILTERGSSFGYNNLVVDMRSIPVMQQTGYPVVFDATHSVQLPGGAGDRSSGQRQYAPVLAKAAVAAGADGLFFETHPDPDKALSDGPNMVPLADLKAAVGEAVRIWKALRQASPTTVAN